MASDSTILPTPEGPSAKSATRKIAPAGSGRTAKKTSTPAKDKAVVRGKSGESYEKLGELPKSYQTGDLFLAARDPYWLFTYWDVDLESFPTEQMLDKERTFYLKVFRIGGELVDQILVQNDARNWYFPIKEPGLSYYVELGFNNTICKWSVIGRSNTIDAPADAFSEGKVEFASVPFHLSFQRLLDLVGGQAGPDEALVSTLSKMQNGGPSSLQALAPAWTTEQKHFLELLVGEDLVSQVSLGSAQIDENFRQQLGQALSRRLSSPSSSELSFLRDLASSQAWLFGESSLLSGIQSSWIGSPGDMISASGGASGGMSSGGAFGGLGALLQLATEAGGMSSGSGGFGATSAGSSGGMIAGSGGMMSILEMVVPLGGSSSDFSRSSWSEGFSWRGGDSSWGLGGESSWSGASRSSWSTPLNELHGERAGTFSLHVTAEVVFRGETLPDSSVWIDGKPVTLAADGSFQYRFRPLDEDAEIPIVAESRDGQDIRFARLSFKRGTAHLKESGLSGFKA